MTNLNNSQLRRLDLTLLLVFETAIETRKLGDVAKHLGLTPSAISHALQRLRDVFGDDLFIRHHVGVRPTRRALELQPLVRQAITALRSAIEPQRFEPSQINRVFRIAALDYAIVMAGPAIVRKMLQHAPNARLSFVTMGREESIAALRNGAIDLSIGVYSAADAEIDISHLTHDRFVCAARANHPALKKKLNPKTFSALDHILVSGSGDLAGPVDTVLAKLGQTRRVVAAVPQFLACFAALEVSDAIAAVPEKLAKSYAKKMGLKLHPLPIVMPPFDVSAAISKITSPDPALQWLLGLIKAEFE
jgi:DNA-binding transcriptional LysR family regulator